MAAPTALLTWPSAFWTLGVLGGLTPVDGTGLDGLVVVPVAAAGVVALLPFLAFGAFVLSAAAGHLVALVVGPVCPGGAPPGSGTHALGSDGSVSLTPGWLGPSHE